MTAFVEIVFDNTDRRMPIDKDNVSVRRTIGAKKDDYSLDGKNATKTEVFNLLESCGFTKSNPYYIVQQGKIAELTLMDDRRRLELLKEISGATVYDERKAESLKLLEEVKTRRQKTDEIIQVVAKRIKNLEEEQKELVEYQQLEKTRRCVEYELTDRDWRTVQERIEALEITRRDAVIELHQVQRESANLQQQLTDAEAELSSVTGNKQRLAAAYQEADKTRSACLDELTRARLELSDDKKRSEDAAKIRADLHSEVARVQAECQQVEAELERAKPSLTGELERHHELLQRRQVCEAQRGVLLAKQGRGSQYTSTKQRNKALQEEVARRNERSERASKQLKTAEAELKKTEAATSASAEVTKKRKAEAEALEKEICGPIHEALSRVSKELEGWAEKRRLLMQEREKLSRSNQEAERQVSQLQQRIESTMPRPQRTALMEVRRWAAQKGLEDGIHGTLLDNIAVPPTYCIAVESTAGSSLFNLLVRDDDVAGQIVSHVRKGSLGSIVCTPLNQLQRKRLQYPRLQGVRPLVDIIECPDWARGAVEQVFSRTVVCSSLELCDEVSRKHGLDAITLDGDKVSSRGALTGGYQDPSKFVRISNSLKLREAKATIANLAPQLQEVEMKAQEAYTQLDDLHSQRRSLQDERGQKRNALVAAAEAAQEAEGHIARQEEAARRHRDRCSEQRNHIAECKAAVEALQAEMATTTLGELTEEEQSELQRLAEELRSMTQMIDASGQQSHQLQRDLKGKEQHLHGFLRKRLHDLEAEIRRDAQADLDEALEEKTKAVDRLTRSHQESDTAAQAILTQQNENEQHLISSKEQVEKLQKQESEMKENMEKSTGLLDEIALKVNNLIKKKGEADEKLRSLTLVSSDMAKYSKMGVQQLLKLLAQTNKALSKFEHVNKKAIDQFTTFTDQLQDLERKRTEIEESLLAVEQFMSRVDEQKDETLRETLEKVGKHFNDIFSELVHKGMAKLRFLTAEEQAADADGEATRGVRIEVSFTGQSTSFLTMNQLSGGQKTVVAIALIFAIQRLEPAPFYLFDEIDAALDTQYRTAVARLIKRDASREGGRPGAQMVITTFRPEVINESDRFYRVYQKNRVSRIECVPQKEAKRVIEEQTRLEGLDNQEA
eukprot:TRINITY_DN4343_c1_g1_i5.p1 TRINITY_DN4343_c1_g1~~TRINITY_DN4343_c1_g1_i5.p1  ORF type:complete len:1129 (+),score=316.84 TRINITY_DN4343_c1_g1_i5:239-3625(+)